MGLENYFAARRAERDTLKAASARSPSNLLLPNLLQGLEPEKPNALQSSLANADLEGKWEGIPPARRQVGISALQGGDTMATGSFGAGDPAGLQVAFAFQTPAIAYASFKVVGFEVTGWLDGDDGVDGYSVANFPLYGQVNIVVDDLTPRGYPNLVYRDQQMSLGGQFGLRSHQSFNGIRDNSRIRRLNTVTVSGYVTNPFPIPASPVGNKIVFALSIKVLLNVLSDDVFELSP